MIDIIYGGVPQELRQAVMDAVEEALVGYIGAKPGRVRPRILRMEIELELGEGREVQGPATAAEIPGPFKNDPNWKASGGAKLGGEQHQNDEVQLREQGRSQAEIGQVDEAKAAGASGNPQIPETMLTVDELTARREEKLFCLALGTVQAHRRASASLLQRALKIGYTKASRLMDLMEERGMLHPLNGEKSGTATRELAERWEERIKAWLVKSPYPATESETVH
ncbi:MAG TPA: DNA translocase FtsK [Chthoniobacteraceae bacterium]|nr:DNA translocase FtsK [Chthoniobacteraceae bacterium]